MRHRIFDLAVPGRDFEELKTSPTRKSRDGLRGLISCLRAAPLQGPTASLFAAGSYAGSIGLYDPRAWTPECYRVHAHDAGVTSLCFSPCGSMIFSGGRKDRAIYCWDLRMLSEDTTLGNVGLSERNPLLCQFPRVADTNAMIQFDVHWGGRHLITGGTDGLAHIYDIYSGRDVASFPQLGDAVCGAAFSPGPVRQGAAADCGSITAFLDVAISTGQRHFDIPGATEEEGEEEQEEEEAREEAHEQRVLNSLQVMEVPLPREEREKEDSGETEGHEKSDDP